ncbi:MAG TPA: CPBP family glutamic-type intramembrane protease [Candidatus Lokiarchaeia archaeon]|nr:CPBP family glutamic-type intramembrane protease [Candidatus Lokiarchaeia archaeon]
MTPDVKEPEVKFCLYCGNTLEAGAINCPSCGKPFEEPAKPSREWKLRKTKSTLQHVRICKRCGATIESNVLLQCPLCGAELPEILPLPRVEAGQYLFHDGKKQLIESKDLKVDPDVWKLREMGGVFTTSLVIFIVIQFAITLFLQISSNAVSLTATLPLTMTQILIGSAIGLFLAVYPLYYVFTQRMNPENKLGLHASPFSIIMGIILGVGLFFVVLGGDFIDNALGQLSSVFQEPAETAIQTNLILNATPVEQVGFILLLAIQNISQEITFRGVLLKGMDDALPKKRKVIKAILITALLYAAIFSFLDFSLAYMISDLFVGIFLSVGYYLGKKSIVTTMIAQGIFSVFYVLMLFGIILV